MISLFSDRHIFGKSVVCYIYLCRIVFIVQKNYQEFPGYARCQIVDCDSCVVVPWCCIGVRWTCVRKCPWDRGRVWGPVTIVQHNPRLVWDSRTRVIGKGNIESAWKIKRQKLNVLLSRPSQHLFNIFCFIQFFPSTIWYICNRKLI